MTAALHRILFVCCGNTCRSVFAEYLTNARIAEVRAESAGTRPQTAADAVNAVDTLRAQFGIDASGHQPRPVAALDLRAYDYVIALDPEAVAAVKGTAAVLPERLLTWSIPDPWGGDLSEYDDCALRVVRHVAALKRQLMTNRHAGD